jgi:hypothetical protein
MEGGIENGDMRAMRKHRPRSPVAGDIGGIVQGRKAVEALDFAGHGLAHHDCFREAVASMHHPVTDGGQTKRMLARGAVLTVLGTGAFLTLTYVQRGAPRMLFLFGLLIPGPALLLGGLKRLTRKPH